MEELQTQMSVIILILEFIIIIIFIFLIDKNSCIKELKTECNKSRLKMLAYYANYIELYTDSIKLEG